MTLGCLEADIDKGCDMGLDMWASDSVEEELRMSMEVAVE